MIPFWLRTSTPKGRRLCRFCTGAIFRQKRRLLPMQHQQQQKATMTTASTQLFLLGRGSYCTTRVAFLSTTPTTRSTDEFAEEATQNNNNNVTPPSPTMTTNFVASWKRLQEKLVQSPLGTMQSKDWRQAQDLLKTLRTHRALDRSPQAALA